MNPHLPPGHPEVKSPKVGVLLLNLGTPDATDYWSMRRYLSEFLSDRRVIEINPLLPINRHGSMSFQCHKTPRSTPMITKVH